MATHPIYRASQGLTPWARRVLNHRVEGVLGTVNPDGRPHVVPLWFSFDGERFLMPSGSTTRKVRNVEATARARVLVSAPPETTEQTGWVAADGSARIARGDEAIQLNASAVSRYVSEEGRDDYEKTFGPLTDVTIVLTPERWQTWDDSQMFGRILEHGYSAEEGASWFLPYHT